MQRASPNDLDRVFKALGHVTRRRILQLLAQSPRYPYEISKLLDLNRRVVLKHLEALEEAGLVEHETGESDLGPDRTYYRLSVSFGLSTTILPNSFMIRVTRARPETTEPAARAVRPRADVRAVKALLTELSRINERIARLDEERVRLAEVRGQIIRQIEAIMRACDWDDESCMRVRSLIDPARVELGADPVTGLDAWSETVREVLRLFEEFFKTGEMRSRRM
ncbi:MAG: ArsR/SmtB family transcription factor [Candidatus Thorarchaeota archaeon]